MPRTRAADQGRVGAGVDRRQRVVAGLTWLAAALVVAAAIRQAIHVPAMGIDIEPGRNAAEALLDARNVYADPTFVYPPSAAVLFLPPTLGSLHTTQVTWICLSALAIVVACVLATSPLGSRWAPLAGAATAMLLLGSALARDTVGLGNTSLLLAPVAVLVLLLFERERWTAGCAVLVASFLLKPLLAPLILLPLLRLQWRPLVYTGIPLLVLVAVSVIAVPGGSRAPSVFRDLSSGGVLVGRGRSTTSPCTAWVFGSETQVRFKRCGCSSASACWRGC
jgi:Glycosyltransferase family 87